jgi:D-erythro-7,8-dihydroneopterin triphosphate epimerase
MDKIIIRDLLLRCIIGIYPEEREKEQDVLINVALECDMSKAAATDSIEDAVDYKAINKEIISLVQGSSFQLIETLADRILAVCMTNAKVLGATVTVDKPGALRFARSVAVERSASRDSSD